MSVRADWHTPTMTIDLADPFADPQAELARLLGEEARLADRGVTCELKDRDWSHPTCIMCPVRGRHDVADLCLIGVAQQKAIGHVRTC